MNAPPLPAGADAVDQFLFVDHRGFCEQIATSLTVMLRSLGVPARVVAGYAPGLRNPFTGLYEVRASDAHLWTEVWFPGIGWQSFDPTAVVPLAGDQPSYHAGTGLGAYLGDRLSGIPELGGDRRPSCRCGSPSSPAPSCLSPLPWMKRRRRPKPSWAESCLARLELAGAAQGRPTTANETVYEYVDAVGRSAPGAGHLDRVAAVVSSAAFSGKDVTDDDRRWVERALDEVTPSRRRRHRLAVRSRSKVETG